MVTAAAMKSSSKSQWNVNGIRNPFGYQPWNTARTFPSMFDILGSDIVVMQELKIQRKDLKDDMVMIDGWDCYFSLPKHKKGYSGVGIYTRNATCAPIRAEEGLLGVLPSPSGPPYCELPKAESIGGYPSEQQVAELGVDPALLDAEGRCLVVEFPAFVLLGVYSPANSNGLRDDFRYGFICALDCRIRNLIAEGKHVILVGDLNVSRDELDSAGATEDMRKTGITHEEYISTPNRRIFNQLIVGGEVSGERDEGRERGVLWDTTRAFYPDRKGMYTHWEQKINARPGNFGSRIDYVLVCESIRSWVKDANIQEGLLGSDHCPVFADFNEVINWEGQETKLIDKMSPPGVFQEGVRQRDWTVQAVPAFSAKRMPEFDKRRSIKAMFAKPVLKKDQSSTAHGPDANISSTQEEGPSAPDDQIGEHVAIAHQLNDDVGSAATSSKPASPGLKRKASSPVKTSSSKKLKANGEPPKSRGQQSLKGFFSKPAASPAKSTLAQTSEMIEGNSTTQNATSGSGNGDSFIAEQATRNTLISSAPSTTPMGSQVSVAEAENDGSPSSAASTSPSRISAKFAAVEKNQKSWHTLFNRPVAPLCEGHDERCKTMQTKKKGSNQGRSFWMYSTGIGTLPNPSKRAQIAIAGVPELQGQVQLLLLMVVARKTISHLETRRRW
ncbi:hypothetical protein B0A50_06501 [Salinomyces thailandicus]|uniref:Endonuclease/exonuclease/phosphatase domain-containing protein n=1 Tax=Salinomyces thailandicus TaxID=706561 RepID=A0A4U0TPK1_9PEZI|nr:hypothetical protein B0A50_06501 [Salinomyces thailandica]